MSRLRVPVGERDHVRGPAHALVTLVEYGDFQCPFSGEAFWVLREIENRFAGDLRFVYRHFPLAEIHPYAPLAAEASEAASAQGKFWDMRELLFQNQPHFDVEALLAYATELDLDVESFAEDLANERFADRIRHDFMSGVRSGVNGTPCLFINDDRYDGRVDESDLSDAIDAARRARRIEIR
jgi:protein-disulfide isomerase